MPALAGSDVLVPQAAHAGEQRVDVRGSRRAEKSQRRRIRSDGRRWRHRFPRTLRRRRQEGERGGLQEAAVAVDATPQVLQPPVPLRGHRRPGGWRTRRGAGGGLGETRGAGPHPEAAEGSGAQGGAVLAVYVDAGHTQRFSHAARVPIREVRREHQPSAAVDRHRRVQPPKLPDVRLPAVHQGGRPRRQPADGGHVRFVRFRLEPAG